MIRLEQVRYAYGPASRPAVDNLSFALEAGQMIAVAGANGSGKSTLARLMKGNLLPDQGRISVDGLDSADKEQQGEIGRRVGLVGPVPDHQFISNLVADDVAFGPQNLGLTHTEINIRVDAALKTVSMEDYAQYPPYLLSGGQKQRVCLAGVLAMQPRYLILDEPTAMLDAAGRRDLLMTLERLRRESRVGILLITHHLEEARLADQIFIMSQGRLAARLSWQELAARQTFLEQMGLELPELPGLIDRLKKQGLLSPAWEADSLDEVGEYLCRYACNR